MEEKEWKEVKEFQQQKVSIPSLCNRYHIDKDVIEIIFKSDSYKEYQKLLKGLEDEVSQVVSDQHMEIVGPERAGYYRQLIAKKHQENDNLKENRSWLLEQVYFLRKSVSFLENRKKELEYGISMMEKTIMTGIHAVENFNENEEFTKIPDKIKKIGG